MPSAPSRACSVATCPNLATYRGRCITHARADSSLRYHSAGNVYDATWRKLRRRKLAANPWCEIQSHCLGLLPEAFATEVDHIVPVRDRPDLRLVWTNLQSSCHRCHSGKTWNEVQQGNGLRG